MDRKEPSLEEQARLFLKFGVPTFEEWVARQILEEIRLPLSTKVLREFDKRRRERGSE